jgi:hypothetical protein
MWKKVKNSIRSKSEKGLQNLDNDVDIDTVQEWTCSITYGVKLYLDLQNMNSIHSSIIERILLL